MRIIKRSDGREFRKYECRTKFGEWMAHNLCRTGMTIKNVSDLLRCSRSMVNEHLNGTHNPSFRDVLAYCWVFDSDDDPDAIFELRNLKGE